MIKALQTAGFLGLVAFAGWIGLACCLQSAAAAGPIEQPKIAVFLVTGMTCGGCEVAVKMAVKKLDGIQKVEASYKEGKATVKYDPSMVEPAEIKTAIEKLGYKAELQKERTQDE